MSESWMERVERAAFRTDARGARDAIPVEFAREMAAILDDPQRQEDEEAGRLLRELLVVGGHVGIDHAGSKLVARAAIPGEALRLTHGPTPVAALQALAEAVKE